MGSKLHIPVFDHLDKLTDDELSYYLSEWKVSYEKAKKQMDDTDQKYNALMKEYFKRKRSTISWG